MFNKRFKRIEDLVLQVDLSNKKAVKDLIGLFDKKLDEIKFKELDTELDKIVDDGIKEINTDDFELDSEDEREWLVKCNDDKGFKSYVKLRDLVLLKKISIAIEKRDFQLALELNGRRCEILKLLTKAKEEADKSELEG